MFSAKKIKGPSSFAGELYQTFNTEVIQKLYTNAFFKKVGTFLKYLMSWNYPNTKTKQRNNEKKEITDQYPYMD